MRAQITVFIIIGILVVIAFAIALYAGSRLGLGGEGRGVEGKLGVQEIQDTVTSCLELSLGEGLKLLGSQGGFIFKEQGGVHDPQESFELPTAQGKVAVPWLIIPPQGDVGGLFFADVPKYPFEGFPFPPKESKPFLTGYYGISRLPPLYEVNEAQERTEGSIQDALEFFVAKKTTECVDWAGFAQKGFDVTVGQADVSLLFAQRQDQFVGEQFVTAALFWPLEISAPGNEKAQLKEFSTRVPVRLASVYYVTKSIVDGDVTDVSYVPQASGGMEIAVERFGEGSIIRLKDAQSVVQNAPFEFIIARKNRLPALWQIDDTPLGSVVFHVTSEGRGTRVQVDGKFLRFQDPCQDPDVQNPFVIELNASEPDEDEVSFAVEVQGSVEPELKEIGERVVRVFAKDESQGSTGQFDRQELKVQVALCPVR